MLLWFTCTLITYCGYLWCILLGAYVTMAVSIHYFIGLDTSVKAPSLICVLKLIFALYLKTYFCSHTVECAITTQCLKSPSFVDLLISCVVVSEDCGNDTSCWDILFQRLRVVVVWSGRKWVQRFFFSPPPLHTPPLALQFIRLLRGTLSPEEKPWVGVCNFWWMNTSLTQSSFIWLFNLDSQFLSPSLVYSLSLNVVLASAPRSRQWLQI